MHHLLLRPARRASTVALAICAAIVVLASPAAGVEEAMARKTWSAEIGTDDLLSVGHAPAVVAPGSQWQGHISFRPEADIHDVQYQICRVGQACFAPPTPAEPDGAGGWSFDTNDYRDPVYEEPITYEAGWRVGVQWIFNMSGEPVHFPAGIPLTEPACDTDWQACAESHYIAFNIASADASDATGRDTPSASAPWTLVATVAAVAVAIVVGRRDRTRQ